MINHHSKEIVLDNLSNEDSIQKEIELINLIGRRDCNKGTLVNMTDGDGRLNSKHSIETIIKISKSRKGKGIGWKHTPEVISKLSKLQKGDGNGFYGKNHSESTKNEHSLRMRGDNHPMFGKEHSESTKRILKDHRKKVSNDKIKEACQKFNKKVMMYDLDLNFLSEFESVKEASLVTKINESIISKCCRGDIKKPTRYFFKYSNPEDKIKNNKFLININDYFIYEKKKYKLIKRNKKTCIAENNSGITTTIHIDDFKFLFEKDTNDSDIVELYLFLKSFDNKMKLNVDTISNGILSIRFVKLINNSEIFRDKKYLHEQENIISIFEDEWIYKKNIVKSMLLNLIGKSKRIYARRCEVKQVDNSEVRSFLIKNHIQGFVGSKVKIGLYYNGELMSLMTFGNLRKNLGQESKEGSYELLRFCNKLNTAIIGGASKLFKYFLNNYNPEYILSYADRRWSNGGLYEKLKFNYISKTIPNYFYIINGKREGRFKYRKDILISNGFDPNLTEVQIQNKRGYYRIFDAGSYKFEYNN